MVEFALILPLLLLLMLGIIEFGRLLVIYNGVSNSAREAARWGSVVGTAPSGVAYYKDCAGMKAAAARTATLTSLDSVDIIFEKPDPGSTDPDDKFDQIGQCVGDAATYDSGEAMENGHRVSITVRATYAPIVPIVILPTRTFSFTASRTVFTNIEGAPACNDDIDNDNDGDTDYNAIPGLGDPDCTDANDTTEQADASSTNCYALTIEITNTSPGGVTTSPNSSSGCPSGSYNYNTVVGLTAINGGGKVLDYWTNVDTPNAPSTTPTNPNTVTMTSNRTIFAIFIDVDCYTLTTGNNTTSNPYPNSGTVSKSPTEDCSGEYTKSTQVTLTANPASGSLLECWTTTVGDSNCAGDPFVNPMTVTMNADTSYYAKFTTSSSCYRLTTDESPNNTGTITPDPADDLCSGQDRQGSVTLTAAPNPNYVFTGWTGDYTTTTNPLIVAMTAARNITANFARCYQVLPLLSPSNAGTVSIYPLSSGGCPSMSYTTTGGTVTLTATGVEGYTFSNWSGTETGTNASHQITSISEDETVTANFVASSTCYSLGVSVQPNTPPDYVGGSYTVTAPTCADGVKYGLNSNIQLKALVNQGFDFTKWTVNGSDATTSTNLTLKMDADKSAVAVFTPKCYVLDLDDSIPNGDISTSSPAAPNCDTSDPDTANDGYSFNTTIILLAQPGPGYGLISWSGLPGNTTYNYTTNTATFVIKNDTTASAAFSNECFTLSVTVASGQGSTNQSPAGSCAGGEYPAGAVVTIEAVPDTANNYGFQKWTDGSGALVSSDTSYAFAMNGDKTYQAHFAQCYTLTLATSPVGAGTISRDVNANCDGGTKYIGGTQVTLTANDPVDGSYLFNSWSSGETTASIQVTINATTTLTATYDAQCFTLTRVIVPDTTSTPPVPSAGGSINVTVLSSPGVACPNPNEYRTGTQLELSAIANSGYNFDKWSDSPSSPNPRTLTIDSNKTVTARFNGTCITAGAINGTATTIQFTLRNYTGANFSAPFNQIELTWPAGSNSNKFQQIHFGTDQIWSGNVSDGNPNITTTITSFNSLSSFFNDAQARNLKFTFQGFTVNASGKAYTVKVTFSTGCTVTVSKTF